MGSKVNKLISVSPSGRMWQKASLLSKKSLAALEPQINPSPRKRSSCGVWDRCFRSATHRLTRMRFEYRAKKSPYYPIIRSPRSWNQCLEDTVVEGNCPHPIEAKNASHDLWFAKRCNVAYVISTGGHKFSCRFSCFRLLSPAPNLLQHAHHNFLCLMASHLQLETKTLWSFFCQRHLWQISPSLKLAQSHSPLFHDRPVASDGQLDFGLTSCHSAAVPEGKTPHWLPALYRCSCHTITSPDVRIY